MGFSFETIPPPPIEERQYIEPTDLEGSVQRLASLKAGMVSGKYPESLVLGADTIVVKDREVLGKPRDRQDAFRMLKGLSGRSHEVITGIALRCEETGFFESGFSSTKVFFREIGDEEIDAYLSNDEYRDKAGAYAIQGKALIFVDRIEGCYYNVVGLPVSNTISLFKEFNVRKESADVRE
ncbi:MAG TPA: Maf family protein [Chitinispirillaceae bacterium]|jgi:septum formation protein|nr:Maf family protein [Chitinispirillaceae bacterium]